MFKLLPEEEKKKVRHEYARRRVVVILEALVVALLFVIVGLLPSYLLSEVRQSELADKHNNPGTHLTQGEMQGLKSWLSNFSLKIDTLTSTTTMSATPSLIIQDILSARVSGITMKEFSLGTNKKTPTLSVAGVALTRQQLLAFEKSLKDLNKFSQVVLPVSNLAKDRDISFRLDLVLK